MSKKDGDSDRFHPTQTHPISDLTSRTNKVPTGFVCPSCGHLAVDEDELLGMTCPKCLQQWLIDQNVQQMVPISELKDERDSALVLTIKVPLPPMEKHPYDETTKIIKVHEITVEKTKKVTDSDDKIPGL